MKGYRTLSPATMLNRIPFRLALGGEEERPRATGQHGRRSEPTSSGLGRSERNGECALREGASTSALWSRKRLVYARPRVAFIDRYTYSQSILHGTTPARRPRKMHSPFCRTPDYLKPASRSRPGHAGRLHKLVELAAAHPAHARSGNPHPLLDGRGDRCGVLRRNLARHLGALLRERLVMGTRTDRLVAVAAHLPYVRARERHR